MRYLHKDEIGTFFNWVAETGDVEKMELGLRLTRKDIPFKVRKLNDLIEKAPATAKILLPRMGFNLKDLNEELAPVEDLCDGAFGYGLSPLMVAVRTIADEAEKIKLIDNILKVFDPIWKNNKFYPDFINFTGGESANESALVWAAQEGCDAVVRHLVARGAEIDGSYYDMTPLMHAVMYDKASTARLLLELGAEKDLQCRSEWKTAMMYAASEPDNQCVAVLLEHGANFTLVDKEGKTALDLAQESENEEAIRILRAQNWP